MTTHMRLQRAALFALSLIAGCAGHRSIEGEVFATAGGETLREGGRSVTRALLDGNYELTLEAATVMALEGNRDLAVRRLEPAVAGTFEAIARGEFGATIFADARHRQEQARVTNRATMMQFDVDGSQTTAIAGVRQRTPIGTDIETSVGFGRDESNRSPEQQELRLNLTITQSLLRGVDLDANLARVHQAELETRATEYQLRAFVIALLRDVETTYWELALAARRVEIHAQSLALAEQQLEAVEGRVEVGYLAPRDAAVPRAEVARRRQALIDAQADREAARLRLARMLGLDPDRSALALAQPIEIEPRDIDDEASHRALALRLRPELNEAKLRLEQNRLDTVVTGNGLLPRLDLFVQLTKTGFGSSFADAVHGLGRPTYEFTAGLSFEHLLGNQIARAYDRAAHLGQEQAARAVENLEELIQLDVRLALNELARSREQIGATRTTRELQELVVQAERERFEVGESTPLLVAQAERDLVEAEVAEAEALVTYRVALVRLFAAEGSLLARRGVDLGGG